MNILSSWSGGKDSCYALMQAVQQGHTPKILLNVMNEDGKISRSHGIPEKILRQQSRAMDIPLHTISSSWEEYEKHFVSALQHLGAKFEIEAAVFGDIDLQAHRDWEEKVCTKAGIKALLPLWKQGRKHLVMEMLAAGIECILVSCNSAMGKDFLGRKLDASLLPELEKLNVDVCGENGEFHTLVVNCPLFSERITLPSFKKIKHQDYWFIEWEVE